MITHRGEPFEVDCVIQYPYVYTPNFRFNSQRPRYSVTFFDAHANKRHASSCIPPIVKGDTEGLIETLRIAEAHNVLPDRLLSGVRARLSVRELSYAVGDHLGNRGTGTFYGLDSLTVSVLEMRDKLDDMVREQTAIVS